MKKKDTRREEEREEEIDKMKTKTQKVLPKMMAGTVHAQYVRCGKQNCKCGRGELHGAYFYHFVRVGGKLRKRYLKAVEVEQIKESCALRQQQEKKRRDDSKTVWNLIRQIRENLRETDALYGFWGEK
jgi:hypothetical protein